MLGEYSNTGNPIREYIYLEGERVAMYDYTGVEPKDSTGQKAIVYLHNDQVGQVQYAFNSNGQMIYERVQTPFGETMGEMSAASLQMPVRFPGQYYDAETGFSQNWNRDYDPSIGRYLQSDPIGQRGGINTYGYVMQNPLMWVDPLGWKGQYTKSPDGKGRKVPYDDSKSIVPPEGSGAGKCWRSRPDEGDGDRLDDDNVCDCKTGDFLKDREAAAQKEAEKKDAENRRKAGEDGFLAPEKDNVAADNSAGYEDSPASNPPVHRAGEGAGPDVVDAIVNGK